MFVTKLAAALAVGGVVLLIASAFLGSATMGVPHFADWTIDAAQAFLWLAACVYVGYFLIACVAEVRNMH